MTISHTFGVRPPKVATYPKAHTDMNFPALVIGFELETEGCDETNPYPDLLKPINFQVAHDGSLRGIAYEFISQPMRSDHAIAALHKYFELTKFSPKNYSDRCSVHVHVNCTDLELSQVAAVALLYSTLEEVLFEFIGGYRQDNIYCIPWSHCRNQFDLVYQMLIDPSTVLKKWSKYTALNFLPLKSLGTVEFRQMHGTCDVEKLTKWVNIIGSIFKYAIERPIVQIIGQIKDLNTNSHYEQFFHDVLGGNLQYNDEYRAKLEDGIIIAKLSLISRNKIADGLKVERLDAKELPKRAGFFDTLVEEGLGEVGLDIRALKREIFSTYIQTAIISLESGTLPATWSLDTVQFEYLKKIDKLHIVASVFNRASITQIMRYYDTCTIIDEEDILDEDENDEYEEEGPILAGEVQF